MVLTLAGPSLIGGGRDLLVQLYRPGGWPDGGRPVHPVPLCAGVSEERSRRSAVYALGECVFGVYLFHQIWALVFRWFGVSPLPWGRWASVPVSLDRVLDWALAGGLKIPEWGRRNL